MATMCDWTLSNASQSMLGNRMKATHAKEAGSFHIRQRGPRENEDGDTALTCDVLDHLFRAIENSKEAQQEIVCASVCV